MAVERRTAGDLFPMHELPRAEVNCQLIRDSYWTRGFLSAWAIELDGRTVGHGAIGNRHFTGRIIEFAAGLPRQSRGDVRWAAARSKVLSRGGKMSISPVE